MDRPHISHFVKELILRLNYSSFDRDGRDSKRSLMRLSGGSTNSHVMERERDKEISMLLEELAWSGNLEKLEGFFWGGRDVADDSLWKVLRDSCPKLKDVGTNVGLYLYKLQAQCELFKFNDLKGFTITTETTIARTDPILRYPDPFPSEMWDMLIKRSPRLEKLTLGGHFPMQYSCRSLDIFPVTNATWPHLRSLAIEIGGPLIDNEFTKYPYDFYSKFRIFLSQHPNITNLRTHGFPEFICPDFLDLNFVASEMPKYTPRIKTHHTLRELDLGGRPNVGVVAQEIGATLQRLPGLRKFRVWMDFSHDTAHLKVYDAIKEYRDMLMNAMELEELNVICTTKGKDSFLLDEFSQVMHPLHQLKRLELSKLHSVSDPSLVEAASQYVAENPTLEYVSITSNFREEGPHGWPLMRMYKKGTFRAVRDDEDIPKSLSVHEKSEEGFLWGSTGRTKRYERELTYDQKAVAKWMVENAAQRRPAEGTLLDVA
ncbi:hypothetical protein K435DRAFT_874117 [Dendrothele bispora CBS 962.96]|uniref:Uncharacterized protein n=1 Tax=Dendrothele bispora (strain CBS 962.96) TaxID=1314807 RepID=A0A4S8KXW1_DENBC|nr:hypothetical protein K435DRAFT_874117 [Dendrothele bispora CBS 962.96]